MAMVNQITFGRRNVSQPQVRQATEKRDPVPPSFNPVLPEVPVDPLLVPHSGLDLQHVDDDLREWEQARKQRSKIPWRQLSLMASLCFGIASFVLPDSVNENLDWLLYGLMAVTLYTGLRRRARA